MDFLGDETGTGAPRSRFDAATAAGFSEAANPTGHGRLDACTGNNREPEIQPARHALRGWEVNYAATRE